MAARFGFEAVIYMGAEDVERQRPNVFWMERLGAKVVAVEAGTRTLKDAINEALRDWATNFADDPLRAGHRLRPASVSALVAWLQSVSAPRRGGRCWRSRAGLPAAGLCLRRRRLECARRVPGVPRGPGVELVGVEAGGKGRSTASTPAASPAAQGTPGIAQGYETLFLQTHEGQMIDTHSVAAGLDYVGVSPIIADLHAKGKVRMDQASDAEVVEAVKLLMRHEGIIPALESSHALAAAIREAPRLPKDQTLLVNLSGRGDKDIFTIAAALGDESWARFLQQKAATMLGGAHGS